MGAGPPAWCRCRTAVLRCPWKSERARGESRRRDYARQTSVPPQDIHMLDPSSIKALFFDVFGTVVDWRTSIARESEAVLKPKGYALDWLAFADAWRDQYQPSMDEV